jgi:hypothetical protein
MNIIKTASVAIVSGLVMVSAASISARAAMTGSGSINADVASASNSDPSPHADLNWLKPSDANTQSRSTNCKPGYLFSQHDVVGDPESCIMQGGYNLGSHIATIPVL